MGAPEIKSRPASGEHNNKIRVNGSVVSSLTGAYVLLFTDFCAYRIKIQLILCSLPIHNSIQMLRKDLLIYDLFLTLYGFYSLLLKGMCWVVLKINGMIVTIRMQFVYPLRPYFERYSTTKYYRHLEVFLHHFLGLWMVFKMLLNHKIVHHWEEIWWFVKAGMKEVYT